MKADGTKTAVQGTRRYLYQNYDAMSFKNVSMSAIVPVERGVNSIGVFVRPLATASTSDRPAGYENYQVYARERNIHIEIVYR